MDFYVPFIKLAVQCPYCLKGRRRFDSQSWFMRHLERAHFLDRAAALNCWFDIHTVKEISHES